MGLDTNVLKRKTKLGDKYAKKIYPIRKHGNQLLTTLLLGNVAVNSILAIFLGSIASGIVAGVVSTALIFLFGEIIPQAIISRHAMAFGARAAWLVRLLMILFSPITLPIAWILDRILGDEIPTVYSRGELMSVIREHEASEDSDLDKDEGRVLMGALTFSNKTVEEVMTPESVMDTVTSDDKFTPTLIESLHNSGHSRFPVYDDEKNDIVGILFIYELVGAKLRGKTVSDLMRKSVKFVDETSKLDDVLNAFIKTRQHLFIAVDEFGSVKGLITVEDILEEIVGKEIVDEFDKHDDMRELAKENTPETVV